MTEICTRRIGLRDYNVRMVPAGEMPTGYHIDVKAANIDVSATAPMLALNCALNDAMAHEMPGLSPVKVVEMSGLG